MLEPPHCARRSSSPSAWCLRPWSKARPSSSLLASLWCSGSVTSSWARGSTPAPFVDVAPSTRTSSPISALTAEGVFDGDPHQFRLGIRGSAAGLGLRVRPLLLSVHLLSGPTAPPGRGRVRFHPPLARIRFLLAEDQGTGKTIMAKQDKGKSSVWSGLDRKSPMPIDQRRGSCGRKTTNQPIRPVSPTLLLLPGHRSKEAGVRREVQPKLVPDQLGQLVCGQMQLEQRQPRRARRSRREVV